MFLRARFQSGTAGDPRELDQDVDELCEWPCENTMLCRPSESVMDEADLRDPRLQSRLGASLSGVVGPSPDSDRIGDIGSRIVPINVSACLCEVIGSAENVLVSRDGRVKLKLCLRLLVRRGRMRDILDAAPASVRSVTELFREM